MGCAGERARETVWVCVHYISIDWIKISAMKIVSHLFNAEQICICAFIALHFQVCVCVCALCAHARQLPFDFLHAHLYHKKGNSKPYSYTFIVAVILI